MIGEILFDGLGWVLTVLMLALCAFLLYVCWNILTVLPWWGVLIAWIGTGAIIMWLRPAWRARKTVVDSAGRGRS